MVSRRDDAAQGWCELCMGMGATHCYTFVCSISVRCFGHQVESVKIDGASCVGAVSRDVSDSKSSTTSVVEICYYAADRDQGHDTSHLFKSAT